MLSLWLKNLPSRQKAGLGLSFLGFICLTIAFSLKGYQDTRLNNLAFSQMPLIGPVQETAALPEQVLIPEVGIELPVSPVKVVEDDWPVSESGASYLLGSGLPGQPGNVVIYGHNQDHLLGPIRWADNGDKIKIVDQQKNEFTYEVKEIKTVSRQAVDILTDSSEPILTLYTCTGLLDKERLVLIAQLQP